MANLSVKVPTERKRILCVDDLEDMTELVATVLDNYEVVRAYTKAEGLRKARAGGFDLYLLDYYLPDGNGLELYKSIRKFDPNTPVLFVTSSEAIRPAQAIRLGAQGVVAKQHITDELPTIVERLVDKS